MNENDSDIWRTSAFRRQIIEKIEEEIVKLGIPGTKSSHELENENYEKASSKEEYLKLTALLISYMRQKAKTDPEKVEGVTTNSKTDSRDEIKNYPAPRLKKKTLCTRIMNRRKSINNDDAVICAVCCSTFSSKISLMKHIKVTRHTIKEALPSSIMRTLPQQWLFTVYDYFKTSSGYKMEICLPSFNSVESTQDWMSEFMKYNQCAYAWERDYVNENRTHHEVVYCCQYSEKRAKSTCKSKISFIIKKGKLSYATAVINFEHDHPIPYSDDPRQYNPPDEMKKMLFQYFENSSSPIEAFRNLQIHLETQSETENELLECMADRRKMPVLSWVRNFYNSEYQINKPKNPTRNEIDLLRKFVSDVNEEQDEPICQFQELPNENFVIFIATACMKRALKSQAASELVYTDNIGSAGQFGYKVYLLLTNIKGEAVPLSVMVSSSETNKAIKTGFSLLSKILDDQSFNGKGRLGPAIIMTDDSIAEIISMKGLFPYSKIVLSSYHFLRASYKWLVKIEHKINKKDREIIYFFIRKMVHAEDETELKRIFDNLVEIYKSHELVSSYIMKLYEKRQTWALCYRRDFLTLEESRYDTWKRTLCTLKEQIIDKLKLHEPKRLVSYFLNEFSEFYQRRLIDCALSRQTSDKILFADQLKDYLFIQSEHCDSLITMQNRTTNVRYSINTDINSCTCHAGSIGILCEHQKILGAHLEDHFSNDDQTKDTQTKLELYYIVSGCKDVPEEFFGLSNPTPANLQFNEGIKPMFDDTIQTETIIDDSYSNHISLQEVTHFDEKFANEVEIEQSIDDNTSQIYPIIITHNDDESIVEIENSAMVSEKIRVESAPRVTYPVILFDDDNFDVEILPEGDVINDQPIDETATDADMKQVEPTERTSRDEAMKQEMIKFNQHFVRLHEMIKKNPDLYKSDLLRLNNRLAKIKNDPNALFQAMSTFRI